MSNAVSFMYPPFLTSFLKVYKQLPCLWQAKSRYYNNKSKREAAWWALVEFTRSTIPDVDVDFVKKRVEVLRASFRKEFNRVRESLKCGKGRVHVPKLWYYDLMSFVGNQQDQPPSTNQAESDADDQQQGDEDGEYEGTSVVEDSCSSFTETKQEPEYEDATTSTPSAQRSSQHWGDSNTDTASPPPKKRRQHQQQFHIIMSKTPATATATKAEDEYDAFGKTVAAKLRTLSATQRIYADKLVSDVLYLGLLNKLSASTYIVGGTK